MDDENNAKPVQPSEHEDDRLYRIAFEGASIGMALFAFTHDRGQAPGDSFRTGRFVRVNQALCNFFGCSAADFLGADDAWSIVTALTNPDDLPLDLENWQRVARGDSAGYCIEKRYLPRSGNLRWGKLTVAAVRDADGRPAYAVAQIVDITERKHLQAQVLHAQKQESLGVLAGGIAHDFNNLLTSMLGYASLAQAQLPPDAPTQPLIREIEIAARRAAELTAHMLAYSGKGKFVLQPIHLSKLVEDLSPLLQTVVSKKAQFHFDLPADVPAIEADPSQVGQVVMNLITNASDALEDKPGVISVCTGVLSIDQPWLYSPHAAPEARPGAYVFLEVSDTGCGMNEATQARMFDPFFTTKFMGRGLGLAALQGIVRGHVGLIKVASQPGQGSTFQVLFPASHQHPASSVVPASPKVPARARGTLLVIDDEPGVRSLTQCVLERAGYRVLTAASGEDGIALFRQFHDQIHGVLLDLTMPGLNGLDTLAALRTLRPDVRVILMSGYSEVEIKKQLSGQPLAGFVPKPFAIDQLVTIVGNGLNSLV